MLQITIKPTIKINHVVERQLHNFDQQARKHPQLKVGFPAEQTPAGLIQIAKWMEYGTKFIPARPFMRRSLYANRAKYRRQLYIIAKRAANGANLAQLLIKHGEVIVKDIRRSISSGSFVPLAQITAKRKRSRRPLITRSRRLYRGVSAVLTTR